MSGTFKNVDISFYVGFGVCIACNILSLLLTPILLTRHWKKNIFAVSTSVCFVIANWMQFYQSSIDCTVAVYTIQFFVISGTVLQVVAPLSRSYKLFDKNTKRAASILVFLLILTEVLSYQGIKFQCNEPRSQFAYIQINAYSEVLSNVFGGIIYVLSFHQIIKVVNSGEFVKENSRMKVIVKMAKSSIYLTIGLNIFCIIGYFGNGYGVDGSNANELVLKSLLAYFMVLLSFFLEISGSSVNEKSNKMTYQSDEKKVDSNLAKTKNEIPRWIEENQD